MGECVKVAPSAIVGIIVEIIVGAIASALVSAGVAITLTTTYPHKCIRSVRTPQRQDQCGRPLPRQLATRTPQRRTKTISQETAPSERAGPAISYTVHTARHREVLNQSAGPTRDGVLLPRGTGDRQPSDPSRSALPSVPPTRGF